MVVAAYQKRELSPCSPSSLNSQSANAGCAIQATERVLPVRRKPAATLSSVWTLPSHRLVRVWKVSTACWPLPLQLPITTPASLAARHWAGLPRLNAFDEGGLGHIGVQGAGRLPAGIAGFLSSAILVRAALFVRIQRRMHTWRGRFHRRRCAP